MWTAPQMVMYIGQVSKDLLKWPRPGSPPVVRLEERTTAEYGMPSTHAMAASAISFTFVAMTVDQYKDVIVGSLISVLLTALAYPTWDLIDHLILTSPLCPVFCFTVPLFLCYNYPKVDYYSPTRADTTTVLGAGAGATIGFWMNNHYVSDALTEAPAYSTVSVTGKMLLMVAKFLVGIGVLLVTRQIIKNLALKSLCSWYKVSINDLKALQQVEIEVPYKFITYSSVALNATVLVPLLHNMLGLS
ncbi:Sphingosine-1-phosphate phosphatase 2 [Varanus komodoensis]|nr:Sphingosine-1-phosphate phosphatase 2 [Varanus komodoensis]